MQVHTQVQVLEGPGTALLEVKKSRFLATAVRLQDPEQATALIQSVADPDARHNCWAWRHGPLYRFHDAGEPGGTAGRPILAAIDGAAVDQALVVVTRHFGGIKLGTGGLVRAYGLAAASALRAAPQLELRALAIVQLRLPVQRRGVLERELREVQGRLLGARQVLLDLEVEVELPAAAMIEFRQRVQTVCAGRAVFTDPYPVTDEPVLR